MRKLKTIFSPRKIIVWLFVLVLIFTLPTINQPSLSQTDAIVTMMCVNKQNDKIEVAINVLNPSSEKQADYEIFSCLGSTLGEAVDNLSLSLGKDIGFAQCEIMAIGDELCEDGVMQVLDYMTRTKKVGRNTILVNFSGEIVDFCKTYKSLATQKSIKLEDIINFDARYLLAEDSNIDRFTIGYFSPISLGIMPIIRISSEENIKYIEVSSSGEQSTQTQEQESKKYISNDGSMSVFKNGIKVLKLEPDKVKKLNYFSNQTQKGVIKVENVNSEMYNNATVVVSIEDKKVKFKPKFESGNPIFEIEVNLQVTVEEDKENFPKKASIIRDQAYWNKELQSKIQEKVKSDMQEISEFLKTNNVDLLNVFKYFNAYKNKEFKKYLNKTGIDNYLNEIEFKFNIKVNGKY